MDLHCGAVIDGECDIGEMGQRIFAHLLRTAPPDIGDPPR